MEEYAINKNANTGVPSLRLVGTVVLLLPLVFLWGLRAAKVRELVLCLGVARIVFSLPTFFPST